MTNKRCPFCGSPAVETQWPEGGGSDRYTCTDANNVDCPIKGVEFTLAEWEMRTPKESKPLRLGSGVTIKNMGFSSRSSLDKRPYVVFNADNELTELNLVDVVLVDSERTYTVVQLKQMGAKVAETDYQALFEAKCDEIVTLCAERIKYPDHNPEGDHPTDPSEYALGWNDCIAKQRELNNEPD